ncbi:acyl-CoA dehydrogenase [Parvularcula dongshanensis]|uniref:3-methylmercaptopropionyl-CoA dehydrogenase n=1 Tax=Parvularcula dongshanensis TaxID=1173995 RepID=A0A840I5X1_9PROT|nr:acyl-CoA dehydrogenase [Parvularcula dongshanensis]MBB4659715.1 alkylation response protein AidB-like acyl-CoA dehydrogenase [Parvularcula dongshanensis]
MAYRTPVRDMHFLLEHAAGLDAVRATGAFDDLSDDLVASILEEAGRFADEVVAPLNPVSDRQGARLENGQVVTTPGFKEAYAQYVEAGWNGLAFPEAWGGQNLPATLALAVFDALCGACLSFTMGMSLTQAAVKALLAHGSDEQRTLYLPKLTTGEWTATMNLSEPQAGSDLSNLKCRAEPVGDGTYKITGTKIWISYGDHDMTQNICHLVLARTPDAPEGTRGISMFLVPKYRVNEDGSLGDFNDVRVAGIEEKLGQHGSPTCVMSYGDAGECLGTLVGEENAGLKSMFVMMNAARIDVGMQAASVGEASFQHALAYAQGRVQGRPYGVKTGQQNPIYDHPDVRRMLFTMKALTEASRALCYANMAAYDVAHRSSDAEAMAQAKRREELLTPLSKAFSSDRAIETTNLGIQVHGGMGFVEETGAAQFYRDCRVAAIYEGTNGIQAIDLVGRKLGMEEGGLAYDFLDEVEAGAEALRASGHEGLAAAGERMAAEAKRLRETTAWMLTAMRTETEAGLTGAVPYQDQFGYVAAGHYLLRAALAALGEKGGAVDAYLEGRIAIAAFYADHILPRAEGLAAVVTAGAGSVAPIDPELLIA